MLLRQFFIYFYLLLFIFVTVLFHVNSQSFNPTSLEQFIEEYRLMRNTGYKILGRNSENPVNLKKARELNMLQNPVPISESFPCNVTNYRSETPPSSVHKLRPGDIDIIGALGDSLTAGNGLVATNLFQVVVENRGLSWSIGGQGTWREYITLPNILKEFNPNLIGYSLKDSITTERYSQFNPSEPAALSSELPYMAKVLIKRIEADPRVNFKQQWKLITIMIGANDFCLDICYKKSAHAFLEDHKRDLINTLRILRDNLPRTIINIVPPPHIEAIVNLKSLPDICNALHYMECYCIFSRKYENKKELFFKIMKKWQQIDEEVTKMTEFHRNDFTVIYQPCLLDIKVPKISKNQTDFSYMSKDCFHISQKLNAAVALSLWNNMLEKIGYKEKEPSMPLFSKFLCPTEQNPYIFTNFNSN